MQITFKPWTEQLYDTSNIKFRMRFNAPLCTNIDIISEHFIDGITREWRDCLRVDDRVNHTYYTFSYDENGYKKACKKVTEIYNNLVIAIQTPTIL